MTSRHPEYPPYIPIIKWQPAERRALDEIDEELVDSFWPCIEVRGVTQHALFLAQLHHSWEGSALVDYADPTGRLTKHRLKEFEAFLTLISEKGYPIIPVVDSRDVVELHHQFVEQLANLETVVIRLRVEGLALGAEYLQQAKAAAKTLKDFDVTLRLLVDLGASPSDWSQQEITSFVAALRDIKGYGYETVHLASGAYPADVTHVASKGEFKRHDWILWNALKAAGPDLLLGYSDYGILAPSWTEEIRKKIGKKATLRYTRNGDWLILRADGKQKQDSIDLSTILVNTYAVDFEGATFSLGDRIIADRANPKVPDHKKRSSWYHILEGWIHHIAIVIKKQY